MPEAATNPESQDSGSLTIGEHFASLLPRFAKDPSIPLWPADVFALCMSVLQKSGAYTHVLHNWPPTSTRTKITTWAKKATQVGEEWRRLWRTKGVPDPVQKNWSRVVSNATVTTRTLCDQPKLLQVLLELCAMSDEACAGVGVPVDAPVGEQPFYEYGEKKLVATDSGSTLCDEVHSSRARVLPKMRAPQTGLTIRSLSHNLALCLGDEIQPHWIRAVVAMPQELRLNLLIVPWPPVIAPVEFVPCTSLGTEMRNMPDQFGFFSVTRTLPRSDVNRHVVALLEAASEILGTSIDGVILPEASISSGEHNRLRNSVNSKEAFLIAGVSGLAEDSVHDSNRVCVDVPLMESIFQSKHHRWKLGRSQIKQYGLVDRLEPDKFWWEHIEIGKRELKFISMNEWLVLTALICEDLARPDPVGDLVRAVGPNLVVALLMDGPQLRDRWSARYAAALADDPGCSVLTVTSAGMAAISNPFGTASRSRVIALWKDAKTGAVEIELPSGYDAVVVSLTVTFEEEWTADGRSDDGATGYPLLSGIHPVKISSKK